MTERPRIPVPKSNEPVVAKVNERSPGSQTVDRPGYNALLKEQERAQREAAQHQDAKRKFGRPGDPDRTEFTFTGKDGKPTGDLKASDAKKPVTKTVRDAHDQVTDRYTFRDRRHAERTSPSLHEHVSYSRNHEARTKSERHTVYDLTGGKPKQLVTTNRTLFLATREVVVDSVTAAGARQHIKFNGFGTPVEFTHSEGKNNYSYVLTNGHISGVLKNGAPLGGLELDAAKRAGYLAMAGAQRLDPFYRPIERLEPERPQVPKGSEGFSGVITDKSSGARYDVKHGDIINSQGRVVGHLDERGMVHPPKGAKQADMRISSLFNRFEFQGTENGQRRFFRGGGEDKMTEGTVFMTRNGKKFEYDVRMGMLIDKRTGAQYGIIQPPKVAGDSMSGGKIVFADGRSKDLVDMAGTVFNLRVLEQHGKSQHEADIKGAALGRPETDANGRPVANGRGGFVNIAAAMDAEKKAIDAAIKKQEANRGFRFSADVVFQGQVREAAEGEERAHRGNLDGLNKALREGFLREQTLKRIGRSMQVAQAEALGGVDSVAAKRAQLDRTEVEIERLPKNPRTISGSVVIRSADAPNGKLHLQIKNGSVFGMDGKTKVAEIVDAQGHIKMLDPKSGRFIGGHMGNLSGAVWRLHFPDGKGGKSHAEFISLGGENGVTSAAGLRKRAQQELDFAASAHSANRNDDTALLLDNANRARQYMDQRLSRILAKGPQDGDLVYLKNASKQLRMVDDGRGDDGNSRDTISIPRIDKKDVAAMEGKLRVGNDVYDIHGGKLFKVETHDGKRIVSKDAAGEFAPGYVVQFKTGEKMSLAEQYRVLLEFKIGGGAKHQIVGLGPSRNTDSFGFNSGGLVDRKELQSQAGHAVQEARRGNRDYFENKPYISGWLASAGTRDLDRALKDLPVQLAKDAAQLNQSMGQMFVDGFDPGRVNNNKLDGKIDLAQLMVKNLALTTADVTSLSQEGQHLQKVTNDAFVMAVTTVATAGIGTGFSALANAGRISRVMAVGGEFVASVGAGGGISVVGRMSDRSDNAANFHSGMWEGGTMAVGSLGAKAFGELRQLQHMKNIAVELKTGARTMATLTVEEQAMMKTAIGQMVMAGKSDKFIKSAAAAFRVGDSGVQTAGFGKASSIREGGAVSSGESLALGTGAMLFGHVIGSGVTRSAQKMGVREGSLADAMVRDMGNSYSNGAAAAVPGAIDHVKQQKAAELGIPVYMVSNEMIDWNQVVSEINDAGMISAMSAPLATMAVHPVTRFIDHRLAPDLNRRLEMAGTHLSKSDPELAHGFDAARQLLPKNGKVSPEQVQQLIANLREQAERLNTQRKDRAAAGYQAAADVLERTGGQPQPLHRPTREELDRHLDAQLTARGVKPTDTPEVARKKLEGDPVALALFEARQQNKRDLVAIGSEPRSTEGSSRLFSPVRDITLLPPEQQRYLGELIKHSALSRPELISDFASRLTEATQSWQHDLTADARAVAKARTEWQGSVHQLNELVQAGKLTQAEAFDAAKARQKLAGDPESLRVVEHYIARRQEYADLQRQLNVQLQERLSGVQKVVDAWAKEHNMPQVDLHAYYDLGSAAASYKSGTGRVEVLKQALLNGRNNAELIGRVFHELAHAEQDALIVRHIADQLKVGKELTPDQRDAVKAAYARKLGFEPADRFLDSVIASRDGQELSEAQAKRAEHLAVSLRENKTVGSNYVELANDFNVIESRLKKLGGRNGAYQLLQELANDHSGTLSRRLFGSETLPPAVKQQLTNMQRHFRNGSADYNEVTARDVLQKTMEARLTAINTQRKSQYETYANQVHEREAFAIGEQARLEAMRRGADRDQNESSRSDFVRSFLDTAETSSARSLATLRPEDQSHGAMRVSPDPELVVKAMIKDGSVVPFEKLSFSEQELVMPHADRADVPFAHGHQGGNDIPGNFAGRLREALRRNVPSEDLAQKSAGVSRQIRDAINLFIGTDLRQPGSIVNLPSVGIVPLKASGSKAQYLFKTGELSLDVSAYVTSLDRVNHFSAPELIRRFNEMGDSDLAALVGDMARSEGKNDLSPAAREKLREQVTAKFIGEIYHELTHHEQFTLMYRQLAEDIRKQRGLTGDALVKSVSDEFKKYAGAAPEARVVRTALSSSEPISDRQSARARALLEGLRTYDSQEAGVQKLQHEAVSRVLREARSENVSRLVTMLTQVQRNGHQRPELKALAAGLAGLTLPRNRDALIKVLSQRVQEIEARQNKAFEKYLGLMEREAFYAQHLAKAAALPVTGEAPSAAPTRRQLQSLDATEGRNDSPIPFNRRNRIGGESEGDVFSNLDGTVTKVFHDRNVDLQHVVSMYQTLESIGINVPRIHKAGKTTDGRPAIVMQMIGNGDHLSDQMLFGSLTKAEKEQARQQYYSMAKRLQENGLSIDWNTKNMIFADGKLYIIDPSFMKNEPLSDFQIDHYGRGLGPRPESEGSEARRSLESLDAIERRREAPFGLTNGDIARQIAAIDLDQLPKMTPEQRERYNLVVAKLRELTPRLLDRWGFRANVRPGTDELAEKAKVDSFGYQLGGKLVDTKSGGGSEQDGIVHRLGEAMMALSKENVITDSRVLIQDQRLLRLLAKQNPDVEAYLAATSDTQRADRFDRVIRFINGLKETSKGKTFEDMSQGERAVTRAIERIRTRVKDLRGIPVKNKTVADGAGIDYLIVNAVTGEYYPLDITVNGTLNMSNDAYVETTAINPSLRWSPNKYVPEDRKKWVIAVNPGKVADAEAPYNPADGPKRMAELQRNLAVLVAAAVQQRSKLTLVDTPPPSPVSEKFDATSFDRFVESVKRAGLIHWADHLRTSVRRYWANQTP